MPFAIVHLTGASDEGPWETKAEAQEFVRNEVGIPTLIVKVSSNYEDDRDAIVQAQHDLEMMIPEESIPEFDTYSQLETAACLLPKQRKRGR